MEGDQVRTRLGKIGHDAIHRLDHQVHIDEGFDAVVTQGLTDHGAYGQVGDIMVVHHVEVHHVGPGGQHLGHILTQTGKVGGEDRGGNQKVFHQRHPLAAWQKKRRNFTANVK